VIESTLYEEEKFLVGNSGERYSALWKCIKNEVKMAVKSQENL
jgi:hypothetical protein